MDRILLIIASLVTLSSCMGLIDNPIDLGDGFFYLNHTIYFSNDAGGHSIDSICAEKVSACSSDDRFIISQYITDSIVKGLETGDNRFVAVTVPDTLFSIIDKHKKYNYGFCHQKEYLQLLDSLNIRMGVVDKLIF